MIYPVLIAVDHDGKKIKPGGTIELSVEKAAPLIRGGFIGPKVLNATEQETPAKADTGSELDRVIAAIGKIDLTNKELFTASGKPKTEAFEGIEGIDFPVSAALRDQAWDQFEKQKAE